MPIFGAGVAMSISIRDMARETFSLARRADELGDVEAATRLRAVGERPH